MGGFLAVPSDNPGTLTQYKFASWSFSSDGTTLFLNFRGATHGSSVIVTYQQQNNQLVRTQLSSGIQTVVASHVTRFFVQADPNNPNNVQIQLTLTYPDPLSPRSPFPSFSGTYVLIGVPPPP